VFDFNQMDSVTRDEVYRLLPDIAKEIALLVGLETALVLIEEFRGQDVRFCCGKHKAGREFFEDVVLLVGLEAAMKLHGHWPNEYVYIPTCLDAMRYLRNKEIAAVFDELTRTISGRKAVNILAKRYDTTYRSIEKIVNTVYPQGEIQP
jgi:hypothetical protein